MPGTAIPDHGDTRVYGSWLLAQPRRGPTREIVPGKQIVYRGQTSGIELVVVSAQITHHSSGRRER